MRVSDIINAAKGDARVDLLLVGGQLVDVLSGDVRSTPIAVHQGLVVGMEEYPAETRVDLRGAFITPGLVDSHVHVESSMMTVGGFARVVVPRGVTAVVTDCHEIANVMGLEGIRYQMKCSVGVPLDLFVMLPSCVPASPLETPGATLGSDELFELWGEKNVLGLGEVMNFPGVIACDPDLLRKIELTRSGVVDGHAPGLSGKDLSAYIAAGIGSDHESTRLVEAQEKLEKGMNIFLRQGTAEHNLLDILPLVNGRNSRHFQFCTDDRHTADLVQEGSIDMMLRMSVGAGLDPVTAVQMATLNAAEYFKLSDRGSISIGKKADLVVFPDLEEFRASMVFKEGALVAKEGKVEVKIPPPPVELGSTFNVADFSEESLGIPAGGTRARVIGVAPGQIVTESLEEDVKVEGGKALPDPGRDILKIAVVERHHGTGNVGLGFVRGFGLKKGAIASSVAHDSHNIVAVGVDDKDIAAAVKEIVAMEGGQVVWSEGRARARVPLPIAGLMSPRPVAELVKGVEGLNSTAGSLGCKLHDPFMTISFLALEVIPALKLTDRGLVDVQKFEFVDVIV